MDGTCSTHNRDEKCRNILIAKPEGKRVRVRPRHRWEDNNRMDLKLIA